MENASKALLMGASVLVGVLILTLMVTLFLSSRELSNTYEGAKKSEAIQQFNVNFTKYIGKDLTIHQVITIYNFAIQNGIQESNINGPGGEFEFTNVQISRDLNEANVKLTASTDYYKVEKTYKLTIEEYNQQGYISKIKFTQPAYKCYPKDGSSIVYES